MSFLERRRERKIEKQAVERAAKWEQLRGEYENLAAKGDRVGLREVAEQMEELKAESINPYRHNDAKHPSIHAASKQEEEEEWEIPLWAKSTVLGPILFAIGMIVLVVEGSVLINTEWDLLYTSIGAVVGVLGLLLSKVAYSFNFKRPLIVSGLVSALLLVSLGAGVANQVVLDGEVLRRGTEIEQVVRLHRQALEDLETLREQQSLLYLPVEQARGITSRYETAVEAALEVSNRWNPAINPETPGEGYDELSRMMNRVGALQAEALLAYLANLRAPDVALRARAHELAASVNVLLQPENIESHANWAAAQSIRLLREGRETEENKPDIELPNMPEELGDIEVPEDIDLENPSVEEPDIENENENGNETEQEETTS